MKAEHRKELQTNVLADRVGRVIKGVKRGPSKSSVLTVILVLLVVAAAWVLYWRLGERKKREAENWVNFERAINVANFSPELLNQVKSLQAQSIQGRVAEIDLAWGMLQDDGINKLLVDQQAIKNVQNAKSAFEQILPQVKDDPVLGPEARYAIAVAEETLTLTAPNPQAKLDSAKKLYQAVYEAEESGKPKSAHAMQAEKRAKQLSNPEERKQIEGFYMALTRRWEEQFFRNFNHFGQGMNPEQLRQLNEILNKRKPKR